MDFQEALLDETDSTNSEAIRLVNAGQIDQPTMVYAQSQTAGRGSRGRSWDSKPGNLMVTYVFDLPTELRSAPLLVYPIALAVRNLVLHLAPHTEVMLKWPNDVLLDGRKISGALHEVAQYKDSRFFIAGIGVNLAWSPSATDSLYPPTCLADHVPEVPPPLEAARMLGKEIASRVYGWNSMKFEQNVRTEFLSCAYRLGEQFRVSTRGDRADQFLGVFETISDWGALVLRIGDERREFAAADIFPDLNSTK